jgi:hypothetical protein
MPHQSRFRAPYDWDCAQREEMDISEDIHTPALPELPSKLVSTMPQSPYPRDTFVYDANVPTGNPPRLVAGFMQLGQTTGEEFYFFLEFCFSQPQPRQYRLMKPDGSILPRDGNIVAVGFYYVVTPGCPILVLPLIFSGPDCLYHCYSCRGRCPPKEYSGGSPATGSVRPNRDHC